MEPIGQATVFIEMNDGTTVTLVAKKLVALDLENEIKDVPDVIGVTPMWLRHELTQRRAMTLTYLGDTPTWIDAPKQVGRGKSKKKSRKKT